MLRLYEKAAIFQPELREDAPQLRFSSRSCRGPGGNRARDRGIAKAGAQTTRQLPKAVSRAIARRHCESASTRTISAEGSPRPRQIRTAPQRERFDAHDLRRGSRSHRRNRNTQFFFLDHTDLRRGSCADRRNRKKPSGFEPRPCESPQKEKVLSF